MENIFDIFWGALPDTLFFSIRAPSSGPWWPQGSKMGRKRLFLGVGLLLSTLVATRCHFAGRLLPDLHFGNLVVISGSIFNIPVDFLDISAVKRYQSAANPDWYRQLRETIPISSQPSLVSSPVPIGGQL